MRAMFSILIFLLIAGFQFVGATVFVPVFQSSDLSSNKSSCQPILSTSIDWSVLTTSSCSLRSAWHLCHYLSYDSSYAGVDRCVIEISPELLGQTMAWNNSFGELSWYHPAIGLDNGLNSSISIEIHGNGVDIFGGNVSMVVTRSNLDNSTVKWSEFPLMTSGLTANYAESVGTSIASAYICGGDSGYLLEFSSCKANGGSVSGDTYFWLYEDSVLVEENDDYCSLGSYISFAIPPHSPCKEYTLEVECHYSTSASCSAKVQLNVYKLPKASRFIGFYNNATSTEPAVTLLDSSTHLVIKNMTLTGFGASYLDGGVIYVENGLSLVVENCTFSDNEGRNGGALYKILSSSTDSTGNLDTVRLRSCTMDDNSAGYMGGALAVTRESYLPPVTSSIETVVVSECLWSNNHAGSGGALALGMFVSDVSITDCDFISNTAYYGGSVYVHENNTGLILRSLSFTNDYALSTGGSIRIEAYNQDITASDLSFSGCSAGILGGSASVGNGNSDMEISDVVVINSNAKHGGAIAFEVSNKHIRLNNHKLSSCKATGGYGGCYYFRRSNQFISLSHITILSATATLSGGVIYANVYNNYFSIQNLYSNYTVVGTSGSVIFFSNFNKHIAIKNAESYWLKSSSSGGFLMLTSYNYNVTIENLFLKQISTNSGGAINIGTANTYCNVKNVTVHKVSGKNRGGGIQIQSYNSYVEVTDLFVYDSSVVIQGGALHLHTGNSYITVTNLQAYRCSAYEGGGAVSLYQSNSVVSFINCHFEENKVTLEGGGAQIQVMNSFINFIGCNFSDNIVVGGTGGALSVASDNKYISVLGGSNKPITVETDHPYQSYYPTNGVRYKIMSKTVSIPSASGYVIYFDVQSTIFSYDTFGIYQDSTKKTRYYLRDPSILSKEALYWPGTYIAPLRITSSSLYFEFLGIADTSYAIVSNLYGFKAYIYPIYATGTSTQSIMSGNSVGLKGGGIYMGQNNRYAVFANTWINSNLAGTGGGGISLNTINGLITINKLEISGNIASGGNGGGLEILYSQFGLSISETSVYDNVCSSSGGGAYVDSGNGAGLMVSGNTIAFETITFANNSAGVNGGGVSIQERNTVSFKQSTIYDNECNGDECNGGGVYLYSQNSLTMTAVEIKNNKAFGYGGGISALSLNSLALNGVDIMENNASVAGGAVYGSTSTTMSLQGNMTWSDNEAGIGGGLSLLSSSIWSFGTKARLTLSGNKAVKGSAMFLSDVTSTLSGVGSSWNMNIADNEASDGGTVFWYYNDVMSSEPSFLSSSRIAWSNNQALYGVRAATQTTNITAPTTYNVTAYSKALYPPLDVKFFDYYGQRIGNISTKTVQVSIVDFSNNHCTFSALSGTSVTEGGVQVVNGTSTFDNLYARCSPTGELNIQFTATVSDLSVVQDGTVYQLVEKTRLNFRDCVAGEFEEEGECVSCPSNTYKLSSAKDEDCTECLTIEGVANCEGNLIVLDRGYYRRSAMHETVLACPLGVHSCIGGSVTGVDICGEGYGGELCSYCLDGYFADSSRCKKCSEGNYFTLRTIIFLSICGCGFILFIPLLVTKFVPSFLSKDKALMVWWQDFITKAKLVVATYQIVASAVEILQVAYPHVFLKFIEAISIINPQIFTLFAAIQCAQKISFVKRLLWVTLLPLIILLGLLIVRSVHIAVVNYQTVSSFSQQQDVSNISSENSVALDIKKSVDNEENYSNSFDKSPRIPQNRILSNQISQRTGTELSSNERLDNILQDRKREIKDTYMNIILIISYLILPNVSTTIFQMFLCTDVDPNNEDNYSTDRYLTADMSMSCETTTYYKWVIYATFMVIIYPIGIPLFYFYLLKKHSQDIVGQENLSDDQLKFANRIRFLWNAYEPQFWFWEVIECTRRIVLTAVLSIVYPGTAIQSLFGMMLALFYIKIYGYYRPYVEDSDDAIAEFSQFQIFFVFLAGLVLQYNLINSSWGTGIGIALVCMNVITILFTIHQHIEEMKLFRETAKNFEDWNSHRQNCQFSDHHSEGGFDIGSGSSSGKDIGIDGNVAPAPQLKRFDTFKRVSSIGTPHNRQLIRNASLHADHHCDDSTPQGPFGRLFKFVDRFQPKPDRNGSPSGDENDESKGEHCHHHHGPDGFSTKSVRHRRRNRGRDNEGVPTPRGRVSRYYNPNNLSQLHQYGLVSSQPSTHQEEFRYDQQYPSHEEELRFHRAPLNIQGAGSPQFPQLKDPGSFYHISSRKQLHEEAKELDKGIVSISSTSSELLPVASSDLQIML